MFATQIGEQTPKPAQKSSKPKTCCCSVGNVGMTPGNSHMSAPFRPNYMELNGRVDASLPGATAPKTVDPLQKVDHFLGA